MKYFELIFTYVLIFICQLSYSNSDPDHWNQGMVSLKTEEVLSGEIYYHYEDDMVIFKSGRQLKTYSAHQVSHFSFFDKKINKERHFKAYEIPKNRSNKVFFEIIISGDIKLLRKEAPLLIPSSDYYYFFAGKNETGNYKTHFVYYLLKDDQLIKVKNFRKQLLNMSDKFHQNLIRTFIKHEKPDLDEVNGKVKLLSYYNELKEEEELFTVIR